MEAPRASLLYQAVHLRGLDLVIQQVTGITHYLQWHVIRELQKGASSPEMVEITYRVSGATIEVWLTTTVGSRTHHHLPAQSLIG